MNGLELVQTEQYELLEALTHRLGHEPYSLWRATVLGDLRFYGYTPEAARLDALIDGIQWLQYLTVKAAGAKNVTKPKQVDRPTKKTVDVESTQSLQSHASRYDETLGAYVIETP